MNWLQRMFGGKEFGYNEAEILDEKNNAMAQSLIKKTQENGGQIQMVDIIIEASTQATLNALEVMGIPNVVGPQIDQMTAELNQDTTELIQANTEITQSEKDADQQLLDAIELLRKTRAAAKAESEKQISENTTSIDENTKEIVTVTARKKYARAT